VVVAELFDCDAFDEAPVPLGRLIGFIGGLVAGEAAAAASSLGVLEVENAFLVESQQDAAKGCLDIIGVKFVWALITSLGWLAQPFAQPGGMVREYPVGKDRASVVLKPHKLRLLAKTEGFHRAPILEPAALLAVTEHERVRGSSVVPCPVGHFDAVVVE
jgi:hypothetical protein